MLRAWIARPWRRSPKSGSTTITAVVGDVVPGDRYRFRVATYNAAKTSAFSEWSAPVIPTLA